MEILAIVVFLIGYLLIALEHPIKINKTATALLTGTLCWAILAMSTTEFQQELVQRGLILYVGDAVRFDSARGLMEIEVKNKFTATDRLECVHPDGNHTWTPTRMENAAGETVTVAPGSGHRVWIDLPERRVNAFVARFV